MRPIVDIKNLTVQYGSKIAVDNVSVSVNKGEILGVLGSNGAGKSSMFRAMLGLLPYVGQISLFGIDAKYRKHLLPLVGYVPQKIDFEPLFPATVHDVITMGLAPKRKRARGLALLEREGHDEWDIQDKSDQEMIHSVLETVGMSSMRDRRIADLSVGQLQRIFMAQSLAKDPLLMIMDEPVSGMDVESQNWVYSAIRKAARERQMTVMIALHDLDMLQEHTSTVACLNCSLMCHRSTEAFFSDENQIKMYTEASMYGGHSHGV